MTNEYESVDVVATCNSKYGEHTLLNHCNESDPLGAVGSILVPEKNTAQQVTCLGANNQVNAIWSSPEGNLWAIDDFGDVFTTASISFSQQPHPTLEYHAGSSGLQWAVGQISQRGQLNGIWGTSDQDVWVTSFSGKTFHWDGQIWTEYSLPKAPNAIYGSSHDDIYVVGYEGNIHHWDGLLWTRVPLPAGVRANEPFTSIRALDQDNVYITGRGGVLLVGNAKNGFRNISTSEYSWYGVGFLNSRVFLAGGSKGIFELVDGNFICLKDKGHPVAVCESPESIQFIPAEQKPKPWFVRYKPGAEREWAKITHN